MLRLTKANFYRLLRSNFFYISIAISAALAAGLSAALHFAGFTTNLPESAAASVDTSNILTVAPNMAAIIMPFISAATIGLFLESEYTQGAIRNKIICGNTRGTVFFSQLLTVSAATVIYFLIYEAIVFGMAYIFFDAPAVMTSAALTSLGTMLLMILSESTMLSFMIGSFVHGGKLIAILLGIQYGMEAFLVVEMFKDKNVILDMITRFAPQGNMFSLTYYTMPDKIWINILVSLAFTAVFIVTGYGKFKKCDLQ